MSVHHRINTLLLVLTLIAALAVALVLATRARGGSLNPTAAPASTMKSLDEIPGSWSRRLITTNGAPGGFGLPPAGCGSDRFKCVLDYDQCGGACIHLWPAVLDEETGLVWERAPGSTAQPLDSAQDYCERMITSGSRQGWRLPTIAELTTLIDVTTQYPPAGSPFAAVGDLDSFWTSTQVYPQMQYVFVVGLGVNPGNLVSNPLSRMWCVRGPAGQDQVLG